MSDEGFGGEESRKQALQGKRSLSDTRRLVENELGELPRDQRTMIKGRLDQMPVTFRRRYLTAVKGNRPLKAIEAHCYECIGWERGEVKRCSATACALFPYRPEK